MGKNQIHCGDAGAGGLRCCDCTMLAVVTRSVVLFLSAESVKLCNNLALAVQMIGTSEALALVQLTSSAYLHYCFCDSFAVCSFRGKA